MKLAFSNVACPDADLPTLIDHAKTWGFQGIELGSLYGDPQLLADNLLSGEPDALRTRLAEAGLTLIALDSGVRLAATDRQSLTHAATRVREYVALAAKHGCEFVVVSVGQLAAGAIKSSAVERLARTLGELTLDAAEQGIRLAIQNAGDFATSYDVWLLRDAAGAAAPRVCWNPLNGRAAGDSLSVAVPRLAACLGFIRLADGKVGTNGEIEQYTELGQGDLDLPRLIELLKGIAYSGWLSMRWPQDKGSPAGETTLPAAVKWLRAELDKPVVVLSAYKGDKNAPRFAPARRAAGSTT